MRTQEIQDPDVASDLLDFFEAEPWIFVVSALGTALLVGFTLAGVVYAISKAGHFQPPRVVLSVITGLVAMLAVIAVIVRPDVEALGVAVGTAIGGLVGALGTAYTDSTKRRAEEPPEPPELEERGDG
jgi:membrane associated rhomboid family serine protease